jgi:flagellar motility protein MotE (MotC chaperone)
VKDWRRERFGGMIGFLRDLRLVPIVLMASVCLLGLKLVGLLLDGGYIATADNPPELDAPLVRLAPGAQPSTKKQSWMQEMFNFPDASGAVPNTADERRLAAERTNPDITGSVDKPVAKEEKSAAEPPKTAPAAQAPKKPIDPKPTIDGTAIDPEHPNSGAERVLLERLQDRRHELDSRGRELDIRENLLKAAEKRLDAKLAELKSVEGQIKTDIAQKDEAEAARLKGLVTMYENMKARDAAKIFDRLDLRILFDVATQINPRKMSDILAQMSPESAERLTVEIANRAKQAGKPANAELPKIEGRPNTP